MVAKKDGPLAVLGNGRRLLEDVDDRIAVLQFGSIIAEGSPL